MVYQYSERTKSELIIAAKLLARMASLKGEERRGAEKLLMSFLEALLGEIRIAKAVKDSSINFRGAEEKIMEAIGKLQLSEHGEINRCFSEALTYVTTSCQWAMEELEDKHLL